jgi:mannose-6-phosphate isomerase-like protein (cupin superfamily)
MKQSLSPKNAAAALTELFSPNIVAEFNDSYVKVVKAHGSLVWHDHADEDELFFILRGHLRIEMENASVELSDGDLYVVPKGVRHRPVATDECLVMLIEPKSTAHTGDVVSDMTRSIAEQLNQGSSR